MPEKDSAQAAENGEVETDPKAPLADGEEEEDIGDPVPSNVQAVLALCGIVAGIMIAMGLASSEWVIAEDGQYWQGLFVYCSRNGTDEDGSGSGSPEKADSSSSSSSSISSGSGSGDGSGSGSGDDDMDCNLGHGCFRIDLENQGYTMMSALFISVSLACNIFGTMLAFLGSWVRDIDSKRKTYKLSLYLLILCVVTNVLSLVIYSACFGEMLEESPTLGPFEDVEDDWEVGWSFEIILTGLVFQVITTLSVGYGLLLIPIIEEVEEEAAEEEK